MKLSMNRRQRQIYRSSGANLDLIDDYAWLWGEEPAGLPPVTWTDEEVDILFIDLLQASLRSLSDSRTSQTVVWEILSWVNDVEDVRPFSFENCCLVGGLDADEIRDHVAYLMRKKATKTH
jgi:hypothetical protein